MEQIVHLEVQHQGKKVQLFMLIVVMVFQV